jgi:D-serine deaminase-like pyridoxal phosphate-dependent protein
MSPQLFRRQLDAGAWAITVANMEQAAVAYSAGAARVLVANEVVGYADARAIVDAHAPGDRELYCLVDSVRGVELLDRNLGLAGMAGRLSVLVELGAPGGRTGARSEDEAAAVAEAIGASARLSLAGAEGFEGVFATDRSPESLAKVDRYLEGLRRLTVRLADAGAFSVGGPVLVSAGGSKYFDRVTDILGAKADYGGHDVRLVVRSGCYVVHDHGVYAETSPLAQRGRDGGGLMAALEVWADVISVPEPDLVIVGLGKRDVSYDLGLPVPLHVVRVGQGYVEPFVGGTLSRLDDQHGYLRLGTGRAATVSVGDRIGFGLSHPCTAFDKWRTVLVVDDHYEVRDQIRTLFH